MDENDESDTATAALAGLPENVQEACWIMEEEHRKEPIKPLSEYIGPPDSERLHAKKMEVWLMIRKPFASPALQLACRAHHFKRWQIPRSSFPPTRAGYYDWQAEQTRRTAAQVGKLLASPRIQPPLSETLVKRVAAMITRQGLNSQGGAYQQHGGGPVAVGVPWDLEMQVLEDVVCLTFLEGQLGAYERLVGADEAKMVRMIKKMLTKMSPVGRSLARLASGTELATTLIKKVLRGEV